MSKGATPLRAVRVDPELWEAARAKAKEQGDNLSTIIRNALWAYAESDGPGTQDNQIDAFTTTKIQQMRYKHGNRVDILELIDAFEALLNRRQS